MEILGSLQVKMNNAILILRIIDIVLPTIATSKNLKTLQK